MVCLTGTNPRAKVCSPNARFVKSILTKVESMKLLLSRMFFGIGCAVCLMVGMSCRPSPSAAAGAVQPALLSESQSTTQPTLATPNALEMAAVEAAPDGDFHQSDQSLARAAKLAPLPEVKQMEAWVSDYEAERQGFDQQRHDQFLAAVKNAHLLAGPQNGRIRDR